MKYCVIVDGCSTGKHLAKYLREAGYQCIHIQSHSKPLDIEKGGHNPKDYALSLAYEGDINNLIEALSTYHPSFIIPGSEPGVELANDLSNRLALFPNAAHTGIACRDKYIMHETLKNAGLRSINHFVATDIVNATNWILQNSKWPIVAKPLDSGGGDGFHLCENATQLEESMCAILNSNTIFEKFNETVLIEEYIVGQEYAVNTVSYNGIHYIESILKYKKIYVDNGSIIYDYMSLISWQDIPNPKELENYVMQVLDALGIRYGAAHCEIKISENGPILIECGARLAGASLIPSIISSCIGHNQTELTVLSYTNPDVFLKYISKPYSLTKNMTLINLISPKNGILKSIHNLELIQKLPSFSELRLFVQEGEEIQQTKDLISSPGDIFLVHENKEVIEQDYKKIRALEENGLFLNISVEPKESNDNLQSLPHSANAALQDEHRWVRTQAAWALGELGEPVVTALSAALQDEDGYVRVRAAEALVKLGARVELSEPVVAALSAALRDEDWSVRSEAAEALGKLGEKVALGESVVAALNAALRDKNEDVRANAAGALNKIIQTCLENEVDTELPLKFLIYQLEAALAQYNEKNEKAEQEAFESNAVIPVQAHHTPYGFYARAENKAVATFSAEIEPSFSLYGITEIRIEDVSISCKVIPENSDKADIFLAIKRSLKLQGQIELARSINRIEFIKQVEFCLNSPDLSILIQCIFAQDLQYGLSENREIDFEQWKTVFANNTALRLTEVHLKFLSTVFRLRFCIYTICAEKAIFIPKSDDSIIELSPSIVAQIDLVDTVPDSGSSEQARSSQFLGLCLNPTPEQIESIERWHNKQKKSQEESVAVTFRV